MDLYNSLKAKNQEAVSGRDLTEALSPDDYNKLFLFGNGDVIIKYFDDAVSKALPMILNGDITMILYHG